MSYVHTMDSQAAVTIRFDSHSTAISPLYGHSTTYVTSWLLRCGLYVSKWIGVTAAVTCYVIMTLMTSDRQSNRRRIEVASCKYSLKVYGL